MHVEIDIATTDPQNRVFVTWRPVQADIRLVDAPAGSADIDVNVSSTARNNGGRLVFADMLTHQGQTSLTVTLPASGAPVAIFVGGEFQTASARHGDVAIEVREAGSNQILGSRPVMVRIRKNANGMTAMERDRFLAALAALNGAGIGPYRDFRDMHVAGPPDDEAHGGPGFLPWHRAYLLDFERSLQKIDAEVSLPYWRFDQAAPKLFNRSFMGVPDQNGQVQFSAGHPLLSWVAQGSAGVLRGRGVGPQTVPGLRDETQTIGLAGPNSSFTSFAGMQGNPHGRAHTSHLAAGSPFRPRRRATRYSSCCTAMSIAFGQNGSGSQPFMIRPTLGRSRRAPASLRDIGWPTSSGHGRDLCSLRAQQPRPAVRWPIRR